MTDTTSQNDVSLRSTSQKQVGIWREIQHSDEKNRIVIARCPVSKAAGKKTIYVMVYNVNQEIADQKGNRQIQTIQVKRNIPANNIYHAYEIFDEEAGKGLRELQQAQEAQKKKIITVPGETLERIKNIGKGRN